MTTIVTARHRPTSALHALDHGLLSTLEHLLRRRAHPRQLDVMLAPHQRALGSVRPAQAYQQGQEVFAYVAGAWHPATVLATDTAAAFVRYQVPGIGGTGVETVHRAGIAATPGEAAAAPQTAGRDRKLRIGYSMWGFLSPGVLNTPDGSRAYQRSFAPAVIAAGHDAVFPQAHQDLVKADDNLTCRVLADQGTKS